MKISDSLARIDWNFPSAGTAANTVHTGRHFPGNFIPQIPSALIAALSQQGELVLDPFSGSGTTAVEALALGRRAYCSDRIRASAYISRRKIDAYLFPPAAETCRNLATAFAWPHLCQTTEPGRNGEGSHVDLNRWMSSRTLGQLRFIWREIEKVNTPERAYFELIFSDILFAAASPGVSQTSTGKVRRHHWGWVADNVYPKSLVEHDLVGMFLRKLISIQSTSVASNSKELQTLVVQQDARRMCFDDESVDLVVTSPPYVGMIDYSRANRMLYLWHNWEVELDQREEIGARFKRFRKTSQSDYLGEMAVCWREFIRVLKPRKYLAVVIGESKKFVGTVEQTFDELRGMANPVWGPVARTPSRRRVADRSAQDSIEYVAVFQKP